MAMCAYICSPNILCVCTWTAKEAINDDVTHEFFSVHNMGRARALHEYMYPSPIHRSRTNLVFFCALLVLLELEES